MSKINESQFIWEYESGLLQLVDAYEKVCGESLCAEGVGEPRRFWEAVRVKDPATREEIDVYCHHAFNAVVLALKDMGMPGNALIIEYGTDPNFRPYYARFELGEDGRVHRTEKYAHVKIYGERDVA